LFSVTFHELRKFYIYENPDAKNTQNRQKELQIIQQMPTTNIPIAGVQRFHTVCKRVIYADPQYFPRAEYRGRTVTFCTESCLNAFLADPERFYCTHSQPASRK